jgi:hypothetical protein
MLPVGTLKYIGRRTLELEEEAARLLRDNEEKWRQWASDKPLRYLDVEISSPKGMFTSKYRVKYLQNMELPEDIVSIRFVEDINKSGPDKTMVVATDEPIGTEIWREERYHELFEEGWTEFLIQLYTGENNISEEDIPENELKEIRHLAHRLAGVQQVRNFAVRENNRITGITPLHRRMLDNMSEEQLIDILAEYEQGRDLKFVEEYLGPKVYEVARRYEDLIAAEIRYRIGALGREVSPQPVTLPSEYEIDQESKDRFWGTIKREYNKVPEKYRGAFLAVIDRIISNSEPSEELTELPVMDLDTRLRYICSHLKNIMRLHESENTVSMIYRFRDVPGLENLLMGFGSKTHKKFTAKDSSQVDFFREKLREAADIEAGGMEVEAFSVDESGGVTILPHPEAGITAAEDEKVRAMLSEFDRLFDMYRANKERKKLDKLIDLLVGKYGFSRNELLNISNDFMGDAYVIAAKKLLSLVYFIRTGRVKDEDITDIAIGETVQAQLHDYFDRADSRRKTAVAGTRHLYIHKPQGCCRISTKCTAGKAGRGIR